MRIQFIRMKNCWLVYSTHTHTLTPIHTVAKKKPHSIFGNGILYCQTSFFLSVRPSLIQFSLVELLELHETYFFKWKFQFNLRIYFNIVRLPPSDISIREKSLQEINLKLKIFKMHIWCTIGFNKYFLRVFAREIHSLWSMYMCALNDKLISKDYPHIQTVQLYMHPPPLSHLLYL